MASENYEISDIVKKCKILLLDIEGTTTSISFVKDKLFPYAVANLKAFLESQWENEDVKEAVTGLRKLAIEDKENNVEGVVAVPGEDAGKEEQVEGLVKSVQWLMSADRKAGPLKQLQGLIWNQGYDKGDLKGHVYDDVPLALEQWRSTEDQKVYIYSSGSVQAQKLLFKASVAGDLLPHIEGHFDTAVGAKQEPASYVTIAEKIGCKPDEILFLTDIVKEAEAARASGLQAALVSREGNAPLPDDATSSYPVLHSFDQLTVSNKRKPEPQEEEVPAKVLKTELEADVKTASEKEATETTPASEMEASSEPVTASEKITETETATVVAEESEKMEVEEEISVAETASVTEQVEKVSESVEKKPVCIETSIDEVTNSKEAGDAPACDLEPVIVESVEKTEMNETEKMETEDIETVNNDIGTKELEQENIDQQSAPVAEETPPSDITVQDVTNEQQTVSDGTEIVDDLVPVVEEPPNGEMEELKNVGDVLEKECDEILSKVHDVTNLDNIPVKLPKLHSITEESVNENTNDIVESILDSEMELANKPCEDIDVNTVQEITDAKTDVVEEKSEEVKENAEEASVKAEEKPTENAVDNIVKNIEDENKINETAVKDQEGIKINEHSSGDTVAEEVKRDEISESESTTSEIANGEVQENKPEPVENKMETTDSVAELESNVVAENKDFKDVCVEPVDHNTDSKESPADTEDNKIVSKESAAEPVDNKMESEENATPVDNKMESEKEPATPVENKAVTKEAIVKPVENKADTEESIAEPVENKAEPKESNVEPVDSKMELADSDANPVEAQKESECTTVDNKTEIKGSADEQVDTKMESEDVAESDNKTGSEDNKMESDDSKMETENNEIESVDNTAKPGDTKRASDEITPQESKTEESITEPEAAVPESKVNENNTDSTDSSEPIAAEAVTESKESVPKDVQMDSEATQKQVNGKTNGEPDVTQNGDTSKEEELNARLSVENGDNGMNGSNGKGDSTETEKGQGDNKVETEASDIKVKTVASEEPRPDPIEQPVEA